LVERVGRAKLALLGEASHGTHEFYREQFDLLLHYDESRAVEPLERGAAWRSEEVPETFPSAL
jgi:erythromycin esterase-like protein